MVRIEGDRGDLGGVGGGSGGVGDFISLSGCRKQARGGAGVTPCCCVVYTGASGLDKVADTVRYKGRLSRSNHTSMPENVQRACCLS